MTDTNTSTATQAKQQAQDVGSNAAGRASEVMSEASDQAKVVTSQAKDELRRVWEQSRSEVGDQAQQHSHQAADSLRTLADRLSSLAEGDTDQAGPLLGYLHEGRDRVSGLADRLEQGPDAVLQDVRRFARQKPLVFLACAGGLGFLAGRLVRAGASGGDDGSTQVTTADTQTSSGDGPATFDTGVGTAGMPPTNLATPTTPEPFADPTTDLPPPSASDADVLGLDTAYDQPGQGRR